MTNTEAIQKLAAQMAAEKDPEKQKAIKAELVAKINEEKAARKAAEEAAAKGPMYPVGAVARFSGMEATVEKASQNAQGNWFYTVYLTGTPMGLYDGPHDTSEVELRNQMGEQLGQMLQPGQAFAPGMAVFRNGQGGLIQKAERNPAGQWTYVVQGWAGPVTQIEFLGMLTRS